MIVVPKLCDIAIICDDFGGTTAGELNHTHQIVVRRREHTVAVDRRKYRACSRASVREGRERVGWLSKLACVPQFHGAVIRCRDNRPIAVGVNIDVRNFSFVQFNDPARKTG